MKTNKKALMGMLVAMVMSLGTMGGIQKSSTEIPFEKVAYACNYIEGGKGSVTQQIAVGMCTGAAMTGQWYAAAAFGL